MLCRQDRHDWIPGLESPHQAGSLITDCHVHIQPFQLLLSPPALELMKKHQPDFDRVLEFTRSPKAFLKYMDAVGSGPCRADQRGRA